MYAAETLPVFSTTRTARREMRDDGRGALLGDILVARGDLDRSQLGSALAAQKGGEARIGDILRSRRIVDEAAIARALCAQHRLSRADFETFPPDPNLAGCLSPEFCLRYGLVPWRHSGRTTVFACCDPLRLNPILPYLYRRFGAVAVALATRHEVEAHVARQARAHLGERANRLCPERFSCRNWSGPGIPFIAFLFAALGVLVALNHPAVLMWTAWVWVCAAVVAYTLLRLTALAIQLRAGPRSDAAQMPPGERRLPVVSLLVPLHREDAILGRLVERLDASDYPRELLDICLVIESGDAMTRDALEGLDLPPWFRVITVPPSDLKTKPRAMNYALPFCRGSVIGIYDAEDAPEPDQIRRIVDLFARSGPKTACVQGYLDYYNARRNWLSRCFTIEYAIWFRVILHGVERLGLPVPLGGTTVFFRREALEALGGWDAHNVTEDADLGFRLARLGYRCAFLDTTTHEEANCRLVPWIRQRSRWLKGYAMTWITHSRRPRALWRDLGPRRFLGFQILTFGMLSTFIFAPFIWMMWLLTLGLPPAFAHLVPATAWGFLAAVFVFAETVQFGAGLYAVWGREHRHLLPWVVTMPFYWPLATIAAMKALFELIFMPFYWDKTPHGTDDAVASRQRPFSFGLRLLRRRS